jgi:hypothetical protein
VKKANVAVTQVLVQWTGLPDTVATWEDYEVMRHLFACTSLGTDCFFGGGGGIVTTTQLVASPDGLNRYRVIILWALGLSGRMRQPIVWRYKRGERRRERTEKQLCSDPRTAASLLNPLLF